MAKLAIKGHALRGKEVIQLLEMLGGVNIHNYGGIFNECYAIDNNKICTIYTSVAEIDNYTIFTLEQFEEKYPYKVGDVVKFISSSGITLKSKIVDMNWCNTLNKVLCTLEGDYVISTEDMIETKSIPPYMDYDIKEGTEKNYPPKTQAEVDKYLQKHSVKNVMNVVDIETCLEMDGLKLPENVVINSKGIGSIQFIQWYEKTKYPKTYEECCQVLMGKTDFQDFELVLTRYTITRSEENSISLVPPHISLINNFYKLLICRDAYWKIAGEQMGLDKPWEPDYCDEHNMKYIIYICRNKINLSLSFVNSHFLAFPTAEMRDAFYNNFNNLIEQCKELL